MNLTKIKTILKKVKWFQLSGGFKCESLGYVRSLWQRYHDIKKESSVMFLQ